MLFEGSLSKWTNVIQGWQYRFFVLDPAQGMLIYYTVSHKKKRILFTQSYILVQRKYDQRRQTWCCSIKSKFLVNIFLSIIFIQGANIGIDSEDDSTVRVQKKPHLSYISHFHSLLYDLTAKHSIFKVLFNVLYLILK
jgi:hypothetical protein